MMAVAKGRAEADNRWKWPWEKKVLVDADLGKV